MGIQQNLFGDLGRDDWGTPGQLAKYYFLHNIYPNFLQNLVIPLKSSFSGVPQRMLCVPKISNDHNSKTIHPTKFSKKTFHLVFQLRMLLKINSLLFRFKYSKINDLLDGAIIFSFIRGCFIPTIRAQRIGNNKRPILRVGYGSSKQIRVRSF